MHSPKCATRRSSSSWFKGLADHISRQDRATPHKPFCRLGSKRRYWDESQQDVHLCVLPRDKKWTQKRGLQLNCSHSQYMRFGESFQLDTEG